MGIDTRMPSTLQSEITVRFSHSAHPRSGVRPATTTRRGQTTRRRRDEVSGDRERIFVDPRRAGGVAILPEILRGNIALGHSQMKDPVVARVCTASSLCNTLRNNYPIQRKYERGNTYLGTRFFP